MRFIAQWVVVILEFKNVAILNLCSKIKMPRRSYGRGNHGFGVLGTRNAFLGRP